MQLDVLTYFILMITEQIPNIGYLCTIQRKGMRLSQLRQRPLSKLKVIWGVFENHWQLMVLYHNAINDLK